MSRPELSVERRKMRKNGTVAARLLAACLFGIVLITAPSVAQAHHAVASGGNLAGLEIPAITHSDMEFASPCHSAIMQLAEQQTNTGERFRRLMNYSQIQYAYCLWGLVSGSISDEDSAFKPFSYLAATLAVLKDMETNPNAKVSAQAILRSIDSDQAANPLFVMCEDSPQTTHTGELEVPVKPATAGVWLAMPAGAGALAAAGARRLRAGIQMKIARPPRSSLKVGGRNCNTQEMFRNAPPSF